MRTILKSLLVCVPHKWEEWSFPYNDRYVDIDFPSTTESTGVYQCRKCSKCGSYQIKKAIEK